MINRDRVIPVTSLLTSPRMSGGSGVISTSGFKIVGPRYSASGLFWL